MIFNCPKLTDNEIQALVIEYKTTGSKEIRDKLVMAFVPAASSIAASYRRTTGLNYDDLQGEAILGVVDAVSRMAGLAHNNIGGYVNQYIHQYCKKYIKSFPPAIEIPDEPEGREDNETDVKEILNSLPQDEKEARVLELKMQGLSDSEVGKVMGYTRQHIWSIRMSLVTRFRRMVG